MVRDYLSDLEDRQDEFENRIIRNIFNDLKNSLQDQEDYFLQEATKKLDFDGEKSASKISQAIHDVLVADENKYLESVDSYSKHQSYKGTIESAINMYVVWLKEKLTEGLLDEEVDFIVISYLGFLQRKGMLLEEGKIDKNETDIDNFITISKTTSVKEQDWDKIKGFLEKIWISKTKTGEVGVQKGLVQQLNKKTIKFPKQKDLLPQERKDLSYIKTELKKIVGINDYEEFLSDFFNQTKEKDNQTIEEIERTIKKLIQEYGVRGKKEDLLIDLYDYLERLRPMLFGKNRT